MECRFRLARVHHAPLDRLFPTPLLTLIDKQAVTRHRTSCNVQKNYSKSRSPLVRATYTALWLTYTAPTVSTGATRLCRQQRSSSPYPCMLIKELCMLARTPNSFASEISYITRSPASRSGLSVRMCGWNSDQSGIPFEDGVFVYWNLASLATSGVIKPDKTAVRA